MLCRVVRRPTPESGPAGSDVVLQPSGPSRTPNGASGFTLNVMTSADHRVEVIPGSFEARIIGSGTHAVRVVVSGELDLAVAPCLEDALRRAMTLASDIVVDLSEVRFIDSTGLYTILGAVVRRRIPASISASVPPCARRWLAFWRSCG